MTTIEQLAKEFSNGNPATEAALIKMGRKVREQDIEILNDWFLNDPDSEENFVLAISDLEELL